MDSILSLFPSNPSKFYWGCFQNVSWTQPLFIISMAKTGMQTTPITHLGFYPASCPPMVPYPLSQVITWIRWHHPPAQNLPIALTAARTEYELSGPACSSNMTRSPTCSPPESWTFHPHPSGSSFDDHLSVSLTCPASSSLSPSAPSLPCQEFCPWDWHVLPPHGLGLRCFLLRGCPWRARQRESSTPFQHSSVTPF